VVLATYSSTLKEVPKSNLAAPVLLGLTSENKSLSSSMMGAFLVLFATAGSDAMIGVAVVCRRKSGIQGSQLAEPDCLRTLFAVGVI